jgi:hypothetical protein
MGASGFGETQLQVREAVGKICEDFSDVGIFLCSPLLFFRF